MSSPKGACLVVGVGDGVGGAHRRDRRLDLRGGFEVFLRHRGV